MASTFTWLDYSEHQRRQMLDVIELFGERTTRDEIGIGSVRDAFADLLFPGTSTIQTRAKYFLFVPWIYQQLEARRTSSASVAIKARKQETKLMQAIEDSGDTSGLIGQRAKENVHRLASSVYWQGLLVWGIRTFSGSQDEYHRSLDGYYLRQQARRATKEEYEGESYQSDRHNWHVGLPAAPETFPEEATFELSPHEAAYLREQVLTHCSSSLLAYLLREQVSPAGIKFAWQLGEGLPAQLERQVEHGRNFSEVLWGAQLLYNLMLAEKRDWQDRVDLYRQRFSDWATLIASRSDELHAWSRQQFWGIVYTANPRVSLRARAFINRWIDLVLEGTPDGIEDSAAARHLVERREFQLKGGLARLRNERALELWRGAAGAAQLDLRWNSARVIVDDILADLAGEHDA